VLIDLPSLDFHRNSRRPTSARHRTRLLGSLLLAACTTWAVPASSEELLRDEHDWRVIADTIETYKATHSPLRGGAPTSKATY
jgi:hypothetical protein